MITVFTAYFIFGWFMAVCLWHALPVFGYDASLLQTAAVACVVFLGTPILLFVLRYSWLISNSTWIRAMDQRDDSETEESKPEPRPVRSIRDDDEGPFAA